MDSYSTFNPTYTCYSIVVDCRNVSNACENCSMEEGVCFNCSVGSYLDFTLNNNGTCEGELLNIFNEAIQIYQLDIGLECTIIE